MGFKSRFRRQSLIKASNFYAPFEWPRIEVSRKTIMEQKEVYVLPDRYISVRDDTILVSYKRNAKPKIIKAKSMVLDFGNEPSVQLSYEELFSFCLDQGLDLFEFSDRYVVLTNPLFWCFKNEKEEGDTFEKST